MKLSFIAAALAFGAPLHAGTQLTIYNQNFAAVKETRTFDLKKGENLVTAYDITAQLEPDSVILRDLKRPDSIRVLEQKYQSEPLTEAALLRENEGKTLDFEVNSPQTGERKIVKGKIIRGGYAPRMPGPIYDQQQFPQQGALQPIVEVNGKLQFGLPGKPLFDLPEDQASLKPALIWRLWADEAGKHEAGFSYLTGGMQWNAVYNAVATEKGDELELVGWVNVENSSGKDFDRANVKLMAGDVARAQDNAVGGAFMKMAAFSRAPAPAVTERAFDEYHLYSLPGLLSLPDRETKQVEFLRAGHVPAARVYVYDGFESPRYQGWEDAGVRNNPDYGTASNSKVWSMLEFRNSEADHLGMPLPKGEMKMYRRDADGRDEFVGEDRIDHTAKDETVRLYTGNAFDLAGERTRTDFKVDEKGHWLEESFQIKLRNHKKQDVEVRIVEHLYRWSRWSIIAASMEHLKTDSRTVEFRAKVPAEGEKTVSYTARYTW